MGRLLNLAACVVLLLNTYFVLISFFPPSIKFGGGPKDDLAIQSSSSSSSFQCPLPPPCPTLSPTEIPTPSPTFPPTLSPTSPPTLSPTLPPTLPRTLPPTLLPTSPPSPPPTILPASPTISPNHLPSPNTIRPPTLVVYVYAETKQLKRDNLLYFLDHGVCTNCANIDYAFIVNGQTNVTFPTGPNIMFLNRTNECGDFGAWGEFFAQMGPEKYKKYKRIMFINDTVRGPYIDPNYTLLLGEDFHFTDIFAKMLTNQTRLVGSYINCEVFPQVQSMSYMVDEIAFEMILPYFKCYKSHYETIHQGEVAMSRKLLENNINIGAAMYAYRGVDFRIQENRGCNQGRNPTIDKSYFGITANPMEVVFFKNTLDNEMQIANLYAEWTGHPKPIVKKR